MKKKKIGTYYYRRGYGRSKRKATIYLINGFAYAKDKHTWSSDFYKLEGNLEGFVRVNGSGGIFNHVSDSTIHDKHKPYKELTKEEFLDLMKSSHGSDNPIHRNFLRPEQITLANELCKEKIIEKGHDHQGKVIFYLPLPTWKYSTSD